MVYETIYSNIGFNSMIIGDVLLMTKQILLLFLYTNFT